MVLGFIAGQLIIAFVLTPLFYRMNLVSVSGYLENRFGMSSYRTGAWFLFISKMLGAAVRLFLVCLTLQLLVFEPFGLPYSECGHHRSFGMAVHTFRGGVKSLIWTDSLKTFCLVVSVVLCICYIASDLNLSFTGMLRFNCRQRYVPHIFLRRCQQQTILLQAVLCRSIYHDSHDRIGSGHDATQPQLQEFQGLTKEHDYQRHFAILRHSVVSDAGCTALHICRQPRNTSEKSDELFP